jgi:hypothetical protein
MPWTDVTARALDTTRYEHSTLCCGSHLQYQSHVYSSIDGEQPISMIAILWSETLAR